MRKLLVAPILILGACNVSTDANNDQVTLQYNQDAAEQAASDAGNTAEDIGSAIANEAGETADKVDNSAIVADDDQDVNRVENRE